MTTAHDQHITILEGRIRHTDNELAQARYSIASWKEKYERDLKEQRRVFEKFLALRGLSKDYADWYSGNIA